MKKEPNKKETKRKNITGAQKMEPIRSKEDIENMKDVLMDMGEREFMIFYLGTNCFLRISDLLNLKPSNFIDGYLIVIEKKTGKKKKQKMNPTVLKTLECYCERNEIEQDDYIFTSQQYKDKPLSRVAAWNFIKKASEKVGLRDIGTNSMRKTFGYHQYQKDKDLALLMTLFNHSSMDVTRRYIGIDQDIRDEETSVEDILEDIVGVPERFIQQYKEEGN